MIYYDAVAKDPHIKEHAITDKLTFIYTDIGRGHPYYLDGINEALIRRGELGTVRGQTNVFELSRGLSLMGWKAVRAMYRKGASDGLMGRIYSRLRHGSDYNRPNLTLRILGEDIVKYAANINGPVIVAHPILAAILKERPAVFYQHGELVVPSEAVVTGAEYVFVPTESAAEPFLRARYNRRSIIITGLCIEPGLVRQAEEAFRARLARINGQRPLTGAFFSSGAEPKAHVKRLVTAAVSAIESDGRVILFASREGRFLHSARSAFRHRKIEYAVVDSSDFIPTEGAPALIISYSSRRELNIFTDKLYSTFDYLVSPAHERTNWALGLGIPMFVIGPCYGPFAPLNERILIEAGVACSPDDSQFRRFGKTLRDMRQQGVLSAMGQAGWGRFNIDGFDTIASFLANYCRRDLL